MSGCFGLGWEQVGGWREIPSELARELKGHVLGWSLSLVVTAGFSALQGFFRKGKVLLEMGQRAEALLAWEHCLTLNPHFHPARREMEKVRGPYHGRVLCPCIAQGDALVL